MWFDIKGICSKEEKEKEEKEEKEEDNREWQEVKIAKEKYEI